MADSTNNCGVLLADCVKGKGKVNDRISTLWMSLKLFIKESITHSNHLTTTSLGGDA